MFHKILLFCLGVIGPEFILCMALGQWVSARRSVEEFKRSGYLEWSLRNAFLADMGGFVLHARDWVPFPLNAKQVHYLVTEGYIPYSAVSIDRHIIDDKNKGDGMVRLITVAQILWFTLNCLGRVIQHLAITTAELTTLSFIVCTLPTYFVWAQKPMDVGTAIVLEPNTTLAEILVRAGDRVTAPFESTPLDFVGSSEWTWSLYWKYWGNAARKIGIEFSQKTWPINQIPDDKFPTLGDRGRVAFFVFSIVYGSIFLCGWNFYFPTLTERNLWHISSTMVLGSIVIAWLADQFAWRLYPAVKNYCTRHWRCTESRNSEEAPRLPASGVLKEMRSAAARLRNNSPLRNPAFDVPLKALIPMTMLGFCYTYARLSILVLDLVNLRVLPTSAYDTVNWSAYLPHY